MINKEELEKFLNSFNEEDLKLIKKAIDDKLKVSDNGINKLILKTTKQINNIEYLNGFLQINSFKYLNNNENKNIIEFLKNYSSKPYNDDILNIIKNNVEEFILQFNKNDLLNFDKNIRIKSLSDNYLNFNKFIYFGWNGGSYAYMRENIIDLQSNKNPIEIFGEKIYNSLINKDKAYFLEMIDYFKNIDNLNFFEIKLSYLNKEKTFGLYFDQELNKILDLNIKRELENNLEINNCLKR